MNDSRFLEQDRPYVGEVVAYLTQRGLFVTLGGSALRGDQQYRDIDLLARGGPEWVADAVSGLMRLCARTTPFPETAADGLPYNVEHVSGPCRYINNSVDERFEITVGETIIDLCLTVREDRIH